MRRILSASTETLELRRPGETPAGGAESLPGSPAGTVSLLRRLARDPMNMATLRATLAEEVGRPRVGRMRDAEVVAQVEARVARGRLRLVPLATSGTVVAPPPVDGLARISSGPAKEAEPVVLKSTGAPAPAPKGETETWFKLEVVDDDTGEPVAGVSFTLKLPDGSRREVTTDASGRIELTGLAAGTCDIEAMRDDAGWEVVQAV